MKIHNEKRLAAKAAFPHTLPILTGFLFLGIAYGIYMRSLGFSAIYPMVMSVLIFAGSMEFVAGNLLTGAFDPFGALMITIMVNARHIFYGLSMLDKYGRTGKKKWYLIYGMCDESFSINCTTEAPAGVDKQWFMVFVTAFNQFYWFLGATIGGLFGNQIPFDVTGIDFVMTALFIVLFVSQFQKEQKHFSAYTGLASSALCLAIFGQNLFIVASMVLILVVLLAGRKRVEGGDEK